MVSQSCNECPAFCDVWGFAAGGETLESTESWSLAAGSLTVATAPAGGSMGRGTHGVTAAQRQPGHQQWARTRVPEPAAERTMEVNSAGLRAVGGALRSRLKAPRTRVGSAGREPTHNALHSRRKPAGRRPACAGGGVVCLDDARGGALTALRPLRNRRGGVQTLAPPCLLLLTCGAHGAYLHQSEIVRGGCTGNRSVRS